MKHLFRKIIVIMVVLLISGCNEESISQDNNMSLFESNMDVKPIKPKENFSRKIKLLDKFKETFPEATIYENTMFDLDNNKKEDLIVIFDTPEKKINFAFINEEKTNSISLGQGEQYSFKYVTNSLKFFESPKKFIITGYDEAKKFTVDFQISMIYDKDKKHTEFKIESLNERKD